MGFNAARSVPRGTFISSTMMVMMMAITPSLNASSRFVFMSFHKRSEERRLYRRADSRNCRRRGNESLIETVGASGAHVLGNNGRCCAGRRRQVASQKLRQVAALQDAPRCFVRGCGGLPLVALRV